MILGLQIEIIKTIASSVESAWDKLKFNIEAGDVGGSETISEDGDAWLNGSPTEQIFLPYEAEVLIRKLRTEMKEADAEFRAWSICDLEITSDGKYSFDFSYETPQRISDLNNK